MFLLFIPACVLFVMVLNSRPRNILPDLQENLVDVDVSNPNEAPIENLPNLVPFWKFQRIFIGGWVIVCFAEWLSAPFFFVQYKQYDGWPVEENEAGRLYRADLFAATIFGFVIGSLSDVHGRRKGCLVWCWLYIAMCLAKHINLPIITMAGRVCGGAAAGLLWSVFEAWFVSEHRLYSFDEDLLKFNLTIVTIVTYAVGVLVAFLAHYITSTTLTPSPSDDAIIYYGGYLNAYDVAAVFALVGMVWIHNSWPENFGEDIFDLIPYATESLMEPKIFCCGLTVVMFQSCWILVAIYWTPLITSAASNETAIPLGVMFASFMLCNIIGACVYQLFYRKANSMILIVHLVAATLALAVIPLLHSAVAIFCCFLVFQFCCGVYWPTIMTIKSQVVHEDVRSTIYNIFRMPLYFIVAFVLYFDMAIATCFLIISLLSAGSVVSSIAFQNRLHAETTEELMGNFDDLRNQSARCVFRRDYLDSTRHGNANRSSFWARPSIKSSKSEFMTQSEFVTQSERSDAE